MLDKCIALLLRGRFGFLTAVLLKIQVFLGYDTAGLLSSETSGAARARPATRLSFSPTYIFHHSSKDDSIVAVTEQRDQMLRNKTTKHGCLCAVCCTTDRSHQVNERAEILLNQSHDARLRLGVSLLSQSGPFIRCRMLHCSFLLSV